MHGVMTGFGRLSILVDENTHAFHFFITALLQVRAIFHLSGQLALAETRTPRAGLPKLNEGVAPRLRAWLLVFLVCMFPFHGGI